MVGAAAIGASLAGQSPMLCRQEGNLLARQSKGRISVARVGFGRRLCRSAEGKLGLEAVLRAQEGETEKPAVEKVEGIAHESWSSSLQRASVVSRIFMAAFVWISLFFGLSLANNEIGGGRGSGRRGPRK